MPDMATIPGEQSATFTDLWEYECCGTGLSVGDDLLVDLVAADEHDRVWGDCLDEPISWYLGHHDTGGEFPVSVRATVLRVYEAYCDLEYVPRGRYFRPAPGSGRLVAVPTMATGKSSWYEREPPDPPARFTPTEPVGWVCVMRRGSSSLR